MIEHLPNLNDPHLNAIHFEAPPLADEQLLLDRIYEAGVFPERWPNLLDDISRHVGARGGNLMSSGPAGVTLISSPSVADLTNEFVAAGWHHKNSRVSRLIDRSPHPAFLTDADLHTAEELTSLPIYTEFLIPNKGSAGAASLIQGIGNEALIVAIERFADHDSAWGAVETLDFLRPHIARSLLLSNRMQELQVTKIVESFENLNMSVALLARTGKLLGATSFFSAHFNTILSDSRRRLAIVEPESDRQLGQALLKIEHHGSGSSIAVRDQNKIGQAALHLVPAKRDALDLFSQLYSFAILSHPENLSVPRADLISALYDLTPAEARVARGLAFGQSIKQLSNQLKVSQETLRSQLKKVFLKTGTRRQGDLTVLLSQLGK